MTAIDWAATVEEAASFLEEHPDRWTRGSYATRPGIALVDANSEEALIEHTGECQVCALGAVALVLQQKGQLEYDPDYGSFGWVERELQRFGVWTHQIISINDEAGLEAGIKELRRVAKEIRYAVTV